MTTAKSFAAVCAAVLITVAAVPMAAAQDDAVSTTLPQGGEGGSSDTTLPPATTAPPPAAGPGETTSTTVPGDGSGGPEAPTTTLPGGGDPEGDPTAQVPVVTIPPELADDPRAPLLFDPSPGDGLEAPLFQRPFDPGSNQVLDAKVRELQEELLSKQRLLDEIQVTLAELGQRVDSLTAELEELNEESRANIAAAAAAEKALREHTVDAFVNGSSDEKLAMVRTGDPVQLGVARELLGSVVDSDEELIRRHEEAQARLDARQEKLLAEYTEAQNRYAELSARFAETVEDTVSQALALKAYEAGAQVYVKGFVFPVQGEVEFIDSWGYPRMTGTAQAHWHQGTDIFAPMGTPLVAAESGEVFKVGQVGLGGNRLWVRGDSGTEYYYAHLIAFAEGMVDGVRVNAGDVVGYVGDTGNAKGTPPHLHFQVHPNGGDPVNPYPLLKATYGSRPMVEVVEAPPPTAAAPIDPLTGEPVAGVLGLAAGTVADPAAAAATPTTPSAPPAG
ncbi:MAG: peptidoglycan DD-metalloendopeptidase family protein [Actinomycetia bacterium]|nr:peptidoglycan DD-metalloendopeptidase family protein [Actinomycetes bacterium]